MKKVKHDFPEIEYVECPRCNKDLFISGDEFEKSLDPSLYAVASPTCDHCNEQFIVEIGG